MKRYLQEIFNNDQTKLVDMIDMLFLSLLNQVVQQFSKYWVIFTILTNTWAISTIIYMDIWTSAQSNVIGMMVEVIFQKRRICKLPSSKLA